MGEPQGFQFRNDTSDRIRIAVVHIKADKPAAVVAGIDSNGIFMPKMLEKRHIGQRAECPVAFGDIESLSGPADDIVGSAGNVQTLEMLNQLFVLVHRLRLRS